MRRSPLGLVGLVLTLTLWTPLAAWDRHFAAAATPAPAPAPSPAPMPASFASPAVSQFAPSPTPLQLVLPATQPLLPAFPRGVKPSTRPSMHFVVFGVVTDSAGNPME